MKSQPSNPVGWQILPAAACAGIVGGYDPKRHFRCIEITLTRGLGAVRTLAFGAGLFGMARLVGVAVGCASR